MKTRYLVATGAFLFLGGLAAAVLGDSTQAQATRTSRTQLQARALSLGCPNAYQREPVLVYDKTGSTLIGPIHEQLTVYSDGLATYSRLDYFEPTGRVFVRTLTPAALDQLVHTLAAVGAHVQCDDPTIITDVPLVTVTVLQGDGADAAAHSFSYYDASAGAPGLVESIVQDFISTEIEGT
jgi:hypothetical protein